ncbi:NAD(P)/FAD-dependent oxidoreductase [Arthrospiribacter ruber]|uniref:FAD-dependent oxidoreductase n=1 Tax=Arthrospiribacter ruber TaxID=2487934 RepID=A0A951IQG4_9BACT|nr:FAD-dependent oxidoreductase [Arthrospiribacter ruber]MBW3466303.1 FAD-dependent oxidoreductase [Arthrospiribacter ruber]
MEVDFLLIGQGLAGTVLSFRLLEAGKSVLVLDTPAQNKSSRIAAGLYNPVTGKKMVKTWMADLLFPEIEFFYEKLEKLLKTKLLHKRNIYRPFLSIEEQNEWMGHSGDPGMGAYIEKILTSPLYEDVYNPYGGVLLKNSGFLDINALLDAYSHYLLSQNALRQERFLEENLIIEQNGVSYGDVLAKGVVYCNGLGAMESRFFESMPFAPVKGEILDLEQDFSPESIINRGVFRISLENGLKRVGSTYSWHDLDIGPTERGKNELMEKLDKLIPEKSVEIIHHKSGIRPATKDRRPLLGKHPEHHSVYLFNGLGAKGVSLAPYFSKMMIDLLLNGNEPQKEVNINRYK